MESFEVEYKLEALEEIQDNLDSLNGLIRELESGQNSVEIHNEVFRIVHNIKGNSQSAGFEPFSSLVHKLESKLLPVREGSTDISNQDIQILGSCYSRFYDALEALRSDLESSIDFSDLSLELDQFGVTSAKAELNFLIVDDEIEILETLSEHLLDEFNCTITKANDGQEAVDLCRVNKYDCIVTDYNMPKLNGLDFLKYLRNGDELNAVTGVIFTSGYSPDLIPDERIWSKVYILNKPYSNITLNFMIKCSLREKQAA